MKLPLAVAALVCLGGTAAHADPNTILSSPGGSGGGGPVNGVYLMIPTGPNGTAQEVTLSNPLPTTGGSGGGGGSATLPPNAAQETGGNLAAIATNTAAGATAAAQTTANGSLSTIATNTGLLSGVLSVRPSASTGSEVACQGGTGSAIATVGTTAATVCAAPSSGSRTAIKLSQTGAGTVYCRTDGTTATAANATDILTGVGAQMVYSLPQFVSSAAVSCVGSAAGITIAAVAVQTGTP